MHVASVMVFEGIAPSPQELVDHVVSRLHLVPRYRQRLANVPFGQGRPVWADDPHFNPRYHIRHTALPKPADDKALKQLAGRAVLPAPGPFQAAVGDLAGRAHGRRTLRADRKDPSRARRRHLRRGHHDGAVRHRRRSRRPRSRPPVPWTAKPLPGPAKLLGEALRERTTVPAEMARGTRALLRAPRKALSQVVGGLASIGATTWAGINAPAPDSPFNVDIGPHRRYTFLDADLEQFKAIKDSLGGTLNDVVLAAVSLALGRYLRREGVRDRRTRAEGDGARVGARRLRPRGARQPGRGDVGAAAGRRAEPGRVPAPDRIGDGGPEGVRTGRRRAGADQPRRLCAADDPQPGRAPAGAPALLQPRRHQRARARSSRCTCSAGACACSTRSCRSRAARRWASP